MSDSETYEPEDQYIKNRLRIIKNKEGRRSRSPHQRPSFYEASTQNEENEPRNKKFYKNFKVQVQNNPDNNSQIETTTPPDENSKDNTKNIRKYGPPSMTYGQMAKKLKTHKWNESNLARINKNLTEKNEKLTKNYENEKKISAAKEEQVDNLKIRNCNLEKKLTKARIVIDESQDKIFEKNRKIKNLKSKNEDQAEYIEDLEDQLKICKDKLDKRGDRKSRNYRYRNVRDSESDWE